MSVLHVAGAPPNFMTVAPVHRALEDRGVRQTLVHTGQHYDPAMSGTIFDELGLPEPDVNLGVGSGSHAQQTGQIMVALEEHLSVHRPELVLVYGDDNATMAATIAAAKLNVAVAHVEAGLRSGDRTMPEEINRLVTDRLSSWLFTPSADGDENLIAEGADPATIRRVGNVMIDTLQRLLPIADGEQQLRQFSLTNGAGPRPFVLVTLHRPSNVDDPAVLARLMAAFAHIAAQVPVVFPVHPRTRERLARFGIAHGRTTLTDPLTYLPFLGLQRHAAVVVTDSGGIQEETTYLGIPCLTMRANTERPVTVRIGTNQLLGSDTERLQREVFAILGGAGKKGRVPELWDGHAAERIAEALA
ncbi:MAG: UDP-N-acetylglucosamine 2-epimerase (non-hydrolyzing) [Vicinamibacterales bacterium]